MLMCQSSAAANISLPTWRRFRTIAQVKDAPSAPAPKANISTPRPAESVPSTSRAKLGIKLVWKVHPKNSMMIATISVPQMICSPFTYFRPDIIERSTGSRPAVAGFLSSLMERAANPLKQ